MVTQFNQPAIMDVNDDGTVRVDLIKLAHFVGAPITPQTLGHLAIMVQRHFRELVPDIECHVQTNQHITLTNPQTKS